MTPETKSAASLHDTLPSEVFARSPRRVDPVDRLAREVALQRVSSQLFADRRPSVAIGRYVAMEKIGSGAMGVVYAARDPELGRKVAIKVLRRDASGAIERARLLREARSMAQLSHPNVVPVYDVGTIAPDDPSAGTSPAVFIAMEYVEGVTLSRWLAAEPRDVEQILAVMMDAGRGLAAAHASGLVHRDFKPDNVMVGKDGRARVMDFGLALSAPRATAPSDRGRATHVDAASLSTAGGVAGTPAYMAPEQFRGDELGPACDQFGLCVTLWEALHGRRPFTGRTVAQLWAALSEGRPSPSTSPREVPTWLRNAIARGLAFAPEDRWPSIDALLHALDRGRVRARRRRLAIAAGAMVIAAAGALGVRAVEARSSEAACERAGEAVLASWPGRADEVRTALLGTAMPSAEITIERVVPWLDEWSAAWRSVRTEACVAHEIDHTLSSGHYRRARGCLDVQAAAIGATIDELAAGGRDAVHRGAKAATRSFDPRACIDPIALERSTWPEDGAWDDVLALRRRLAAVTARESLGNGADVLVEERAILAEARRVGFTALTAETQVHLGVTLAEKAEYAAAEIELREAFFAAIRVGADDVALHAAAQLAHLLAVQQSRAEQGLEWVRHGEMLAEREGGGSPAAAATLRLVRAEVSAQRGDYDDALAKYRDVLAIRERELTPDHPDIAETLNAMANVEVHRGRSREAEALYERALSMSERALGPEHPDVAHVVNNLANVYSQRGSQEDAARLHRRAMAIRERALGPDHPLVATSLGNLAAAMFSQREFGEALALYRRALAIKEASLGADHPGLALTLLGVCNSQRSMGSLEDAVAACDRALELAERGGDHRSTIAALRGLALVQGSRGENERALQTATRALAALEATQGPDHLDVAQLLHTLAGLHVAGGDEAQALALRKRALAIRQAALEPTDRRIAESLEWVGESHRALGELDRAVASYEQALAIRERTKPVDRGVADALTALGELAIEGGRTRDGIAYLERALSILHEVDAPAADRAHTELALARVLPRTERVRAIELARSAALSWRQVDDAQHLREAEALLTALGHPRRSAR